MHPSSRKLMPSRPCTSALGEGTTSMILPTNREIANARLPESYLKARAALRACARKFTPERYAKAVVALGDALKEDEVATWPDEMAQLATYARHCDDDELRRLSNRVERKRAAWKANETVE
jgi:hypothetical protein